MTEQDTSRAKTRVAEDQILDSNTTINGKKGYQADQKKESQSENVVSQKPKPETKIQNLFLFG